VNIPNAAPLQLPLSHSEMDLSRITRQMPHLAGTWKGTAQRIVCGQPRGNPQIVLALTDASYTAPNSAFPIGNVTGQISVDGKLNGTFGADYGDTKLQTNPLEQTFATAFNPPDLLNPNAKPHASFYLKLTAKDPWAGLGYYQTLTGAFFASEAACPQFGDQGHILKVQLKKQ
jgi:hypothetical protein